MQKQDGRPDSLRPPPVPAFTGDRPGNPFGGGQSGLLDRRIYLQEKSGNPVPAFGLFHAWTGDLKAESSIRPMAKICELLTLTHYKGAHSDKSLLSPLHRERITAACFDWLISAEKVAPKAYSMQTLSLLGQDIEWVHPELKAVLEQGYASGSAGYKARARRILKILN